MYKIDDERIEIRWYLFVVKFEWISDELEKLIVMIYYSEFI